ncbi:MAG: S1 RNA-binding domain-containing protein [Candidatus Margulisiibacteriota bacterium]|jgi:4-hydroxy-3-methylbut-2-enyl diphosphate reductase
MISEGTKLGTNEEELSFKNDLNTDNLANLQGTRFGAVSEFEKSLFLEEDTKSEEAAPLAEETTLTEVNTSSIIDDSLVITDSEDEIEEKPKLASEPESKKLVIENIPVQPIPEQNKAEKSEKEVVKPGKQTDLQDQISNSIPNYQTGDIITGIVRSVEKSGVLVDIKYKAEGFIPNNEFSSVSQETAANTTKPGDEIKVCIIKLETKEGYVLLSRKRAEYEMSWNLLGKLAKTRDSIEVDVLSKVEGGLVVDYKGIKGFIPASHVLISTDENLDAYLGQKLTVAVLQVERKRRKVIFSYRLASSRPQRSDFGKIFDSIEVGQIKVGKVSSIKDFGVFVNIDGVDGLVHISELSWARVNHPSEMLKIGDEVSVFVLGIDKENRKISLGMKQLQPDPWVNIINKYKIGEIVKGKITRFVTFGVFIQLDKDLEGLIHISELSYDHVDKIEDVVKIGSVVNAKIIKIIPEEQKIGLSLKGIDQGNDSTK